MHNRYALLVNPVAGKGKALLLMPEIERRLDSLGLDYEVFYTEKPGHAEQMAFDACAGNFTSVVAAGGDGTCNEVINGLMRFRNSGGEIPPVLGILPVGRGNDFAYGAGVPADIGAACETLGAGHESPLDVGRITGGFFPAGRFFGNGIGIGFDTIVGLNAARHTHLRGAMTYVAGALETLCLYPKAPEIRIEYNGRAHHVFSQQISILNGRRMGGVFFMAPDGDHTDGLLDLCMATRPMTRRDMIGLILHYLKGTQRVSPIIGIDRASFFMITATAGGLVCHADGETVCTNGTELRVECFRAPLTVYCRPGLPGPIKP